MPSGSFEFGLAMPMAPNPASPMAQSHISTDSAEGNFVPTLQIIESEISITTGQVLLVDTAIYFVEEESLGPKILNGVANIWRIAATREFLMQNSSSLKPAFNALKIVLHSVCLTSTQIFGISWPVSRKSKTSAFKTYNLCFLRA